MALIKKILLKIQNTWIIKKYFTLKKIFHKSNPYFSIQFIFTWLIFKLGHFCNIDFKFRLLVAALFLCLLLIFWEMLMPKMLNNFLFQLCFYFLYLIFNFICFFKNRFMFFGFFVGMFTNFFPANKIV